MTTSGDLLRMLEPAVRPVATPGAGVTPKQVPFEQQPFEALLKEANTELKLAGAAGTEATEGARGATRVDPLAELARLDGISSASVRQLIESAGQ